MPCYKLFLTGTGLVHFPSATCFVYLCALKPHSKGWPELGRRDMADSRGFPLPGDALDGCNPLSGAIRLLKIGQSLHGSNKRAS